MNELEEKSLSKKKIKSGDPYMHKPPLKFTILALHNSARAAILSLPHGDVHTPVYMPVGTKATIKGVTPQEMKDLNCNILLSNTYHLASKPGTEYISSFGGIHNFMKWDRNVLTDSGGFQMVSLSKLCTINEEGVEFINPDDGKKMFLKPEDSIKCQNQIGADIIMALDDVVKTTLVGERVVEACSRTVRWLDRCIEAHSKKDSQNLFPIVQGGLDLKLREENLKELLQRDANGYAIGGLSGGEAKDDFWKVVKFCCDRLPWDKPRYVMGVGYPEDLIVCACLGVDMCDCVFPTRTARFGTAFTRHGSIRLKNSKFALDFSPLEQGCQCETCKLYTRSYLHTIVTKEDVACHLISKHNIHYLLTLMKNFHNAIIEKRLKSFVQQFFEDLYKDKEIPNWIHDALTSVDLDFKKQWIEQIEYQMD